MRLFERSRTGVSLTEAGRRYCEAVLAGLGALRDGALEVAALSGADPLEVTLACLHELSRLFVMQRFDALRAALGEQVRVRILADALAPLPSGPSVDVILTWDAATAARKNRVTIGREAVGALCSPGYAAVHEQVLDGPVAGWGGLTFLDLAGQDEHDASWERWFESTGRPVSAPRYEIVESYADALEAAITGRGMVLGWRHLIGRHVQACTLVMPAGEFVETGRCFYAALTAKGRERPSARACLAFFAGASNHHPGGWDEQ